MISLQCMRNFKVLLLVASDEKSCFFLYWTYTALYRQYDVVDVSSCSVLSRYRNVPSVLSIIIIQMWIEVSHPAFSVPVEIA